MSRVAPVQSSFNGGEVSRRLQARIDQSLYAISASKMVGWAALVEGAAEAMPGFIHVEQAPGPIRLFRFEYNTTQGHVVEASQYLWRVYTNDALIRDGSGDPVEIVSPYAYADLAQLKVLQSFDVLYCFHRDYQPRKFVRNGPADFAFELMEFTDGPFDDRNDNKAHTLSASAVEGTITLTSSIALFAATDVGRLVKIEIADFGTTPAWEPGITVTAGQLRVSLERVYRCVQGGRTGSWQPAHTEGVEWDGMGSGTDINNNAAGGVQWEYVHDLFGIARITAFTSATVVQAVVLRRLPFTAVSNNYVWTGGYYSGSWGSYVPPGTLSYAYGTWRWSLGAFSNTSGWPECGEVWLERLCLAKDSTVYGSVAGDLESHAEVNDLGELSNDQAFIATIPDSNAIVEMVGGERLLLFTASGCHAIGPASAAQGVGPRNLRRDRQHHSGSSAVAAVPLNGRTLTVSRCGTRIHETEFTVQRQVETALDLTRYARHISGPGFTALAVQHFPHNMIWALRADGVLTCASYLPEEEVLGMSRRKLASGMAARSLVSITDPDGRFEQVWIAAEFNGAWHVLRMAPWREDGESDINAVMVDMAFTFEGEPTASFTAPLLAGREIEVMADGVWHTVVAAVGTGAFSLPAPASKVVAGLPFEAVLDQLAIEAGGDNGPARHKTARIGRAWCEVIDARGIWFGVEGNMQPLEQLAKEWTDEGALVPYSGFLDALEVVGDYTRSPKLRIERRAPMQATIAAIGCEVEVKAR